MKKGLLKKQDYASGLYESSALQIRQKRSEPSYIIEGPREGAAAQSIRLNSLASANKSTQQRLQQVQVPLRDS